MFLYYYHHHSHRRQYFCSCCSKGERVFADCYAFTGETKLFFSCYAFVHYRPCKCVPERNALAKSCTVLLLLYTAAKSRNFNYYPLSHLQSATLVSAVEIQRTSTQHSYLRRNAKDISLLCTLLSSLCLLRKSYLSQGLLSSQKWKSAHHLFGRAPRLSEYPVRVLHACM